MTLSMSQCFAQDSLLLTGYEFAKNTTYGYLGYIKPFDGNQLGNGFAHRYWIDYLAFQYNNGATDVKAKAPGVSYAINYQKSNQTQSWGTYLGVQDRSTSFSPASPDNSLSGNKITPFIGLDGHQQLSDFYAANIQGNYAFNSNYWSKAQLAIGSKLRTGPEYTILGGPGFQTKRLDWFVDGIDLGNQTNIGIRFGYSQTNDLGGNPFVGINLSKLIN